jgi:hypothetical protein
VGELGHIRGIGATGVLGDGVAAKLGVEGLD